MYHRFRKRELFLSSKRALRACVGRQTVMQDAFICLPAELPPLPKPDYATRLPERARGTQLALATTKVP